MSDCVVAAGDRKWGRDLDRPGLPVTTVTDVNMGRVSVSARGKQQLDRAWWAGLRQGQSGLGSAH